MRSGKWRAEVLWIYAGAVIPDMGWILQRLLMRLPFDVDPFRLISYSAALTSLAGCLTASAAIAALTVRRGRVFGLLATGCLLHLLMDAAEIKWANGVLLMAPVSWHLTTWDVFQQDGLVVYAATVGSLLFVALTWRSGIREINRSMWHLSPASVGVACGLAVLFFLWPLPWLDAPAKNGLYDMEVIRDTDSRTGRNLELDRARYFAASNQVRIFTGELIQVENFSAPRDTLVSLRGVFESPDVLRVEQAIVHHPWQRAVAAKVGLALFAFFLIHAAWRLFGRPVRQTGA